jgi:hypothetical protein
MRFHRQILSRLILDACRHSFSVVFWQIQACGKGWSFNRNCSDRSAPIFIERGASRKPAPYRKQISSYRSTRVVIDLSVSRNCVLLDCMGSGTLRKGVQRLVYLGRRIADHRSQVSFPDWPPSSGGGNDRVSYLGSVRGWWFFLAPGYEEVWFDAALRDV